MTPVTVLRSPENDQPNADTSKWKEKAKEEKKPQTQKFSVVGFSKAICCVSGGRVSALAGTRS